MGLEGEQFGIARAGPNQVDDARREKGWQR
jgi:hypothetical protein